MLCAIVLVDSVQLRKYARSQIYNSLMARLMVIRSQLCIAALFSICTRNLHTSPDVQQLLFSQRSIVWCICFYDVH